MKGKKSIVPQDDIEWVLKLWVWRLGRERGGVQLPPPPQFANNHQPTMSKFSFSGINKKKVIKNTTWKSLFQNCQFFSGLEGLLIVITKKQLTEKWCLAIRVNVYTLPTSSDIWVGDFKYSLHWTLMPFMMDEVWDPTRGIWIRY